MYFCRRLSTSRRKITPIITRLLSVVKVKWRTAASSWYTECNMYLGIDVGGTKTLVATLDDHGVILQRQKFPTDKNYAAWKQELAKVVDNLSTDSLIACGVAAPGRIDRKRGIGLGMGNLPWHDAPIQKDVQNLVHCPVVIDNDANLAGLSEAMLVKKYRRVLYVTIGTGIGTGIIIDQMIDPDFADTEGGKILLEHDGKLKEWESFASGRAIKQTFGKEAREIESKTAWATIAHNLALGLIDLIAVVQPEVIIVGGGVAPYYDHLKDPLTKILKSYETPLIPIPPLQKAQRPEDAVIYGCYDLAKATYGSAR